VKFTAEVLDNTTSRGRVLRFLTDEYSYEEFLDALYGIGHILLPTYIDRDLEAIDIERSHAIYATDYGSILPSISGLHFTENIMCELNLKGVKLVPVTMHIGIPSTRIIDIEVLMRYKIGSEYCSITQESADILNDSSNRDRRICAVGTSTLKALEALAGYDKYAYTSAEKWAVELIYEPYVFKTADMLLTNFHLPESSQLICSSAFCGHKLLARAYDEAIKEGYALLMYGDSLLIV
jgi:S-adenosylmethionine:tRNA ribosyltransferase-isomerase